jgi:hypothetical protein
MASTMIADLDFGRKVRCHNEAVEKAEAYRLFCRSRIS